MPVVGPLRVCAVCSNIYSALHRRAQEENEEQGNSNSNCWVTWYTKTHFLWYIHLTPLDWGQVLKPILGWLNCKLWTEIIIQLSYTLRIPIFWLVDLYHVTLGYDATTSLTSLSWCNSCGVNSIHHCHYTMALADSKFDDFCLQCIQFE